jgi:hypothetical protein
LSATDFQGDAPSDPSLSSSPSLADAISLVFGLIPPATASCAAVHIP